MVVRFGVATSSAWGSGTDRRHEEVRRTFQARFDLERQRDTLGARLEQDVRILVRAS